LRKNLFYSKLQNFCILQISTNVSSATLPAVTSVLTLRKDLFAPALWVKYWMLTKSPAKVKFAFINNRLNIWI